MNNLNNKGIALVTSLMLTLITMVIIMGLFFNITQSIKMSAAQKAYRNVTEASYGGADLMMQDIIPRLFLNGTTNDAMTTIMNTLTSEYNASTLAKMNMTFLASNACLRTKLNNITTTGWGACSSDPNPKKSPDMTFKLAGSSGQSFTIYSKIVDTIPGVKYPDSGAVLLGQGVTEDLILVAQIQKLAHYVYRIEVAGERTTNASERSNISVLYEY